MISRPCIAEEAELKAEISTLQKLRLNGITRLKMARLFHRLACRRKDHETKPKFYNDIYKYAQVRSAWKLVAPSEIDGPKGLRAPKFRLWFAHERQC